MIFLKLLHGNYQGVINKSLKSCELSSNSARDVILVFFGDCLTVNYVQLFQHYALRVRLFADTTILSFNEKIAAETERQSREWHCLSCRFFFTFSTESSYTAIVSLSSHLSTPRPTESSVAETGTDGASEAGSAAWMRNLPNDACVRYLRPKFAAATYCRQCVSGIAATEQATYKADRWRRDTDGVALLEAAQGKVPQVGNGYLTDVD